MHCGMWLKQHLHDSEWFSVTYCLAQLNSKDSPDVAESISKLHNRISMLLRHKIAQNSEAAQSNIDTIFGAKIQAEISMNDWSSLKETIEETFTRVKDKSARTQLLLKIVGAYLNQKRGA